MKSPKFFPVFVILVALKSNPTLGLNANVSKPVVWTKLGEDAQLFCSSGKHSDQALEICRWTKSATDPSGNRTIVVNLSKDSITDSSPAADYSYFGNGMANGECGLTIHNVKQEEIGSWGCTLIGKTIWIGNLEVTLFEKPNSPVIEVANFKNLTDFGRGVQSTALCCAEGGKPNEETSLAFYYNDQQVPTKFHKGHGELVQVPCIEWTNSFTTMDNGNKLKCIAAHPAYSETDSREVEVVINVMFPPEFIDVINDEVVLNLDLTQPGNFSVRIKGNPKPEIKLESDGTVTILALYSMNRTSNSEMDEYEYIVMMKQAQPGNISFVIQATNLHGSKEISVTIVGPGPGEEGSAFWTLVTVGIVMTVIFAAIIVYILNKVAKSRGWMCYKNRTRKYAVANPTDNSEIDGYFTVPRNDAREEDLRL